MNKYEINFTAYVSDSIEIWSDKPIEEIDETDIEWDGLPLINNVTYDWNAIEIESVEILTESE